MRTHRHLTQRFWTLAYAALYLAVIVLLWRGWIG